MLQSKDSKWLIGLKKQINKKTPRPFYMLPKRDSLQGKRQTESEGVEKDI